MGQDLTAMSEAPGRAQKQLLTGKLRQEERY